ncbi:MAG: hypothetical protein JSU96_08925 [Acidobacteriota bacterium]|nr:MAG: hypothetical protein JSU96_08925 [Acidobacteriota bacterium]
MKRLYLGLVLLIGCLLNCQGCLNGLPPQPLIVSSVSGPYPERLAAREIRRYIYLRTGRMAAIVEEVPSDASAGVICLGIKGDTRLNSCLDDVELEARIAALEGQEYLLKTVSGDGPGILVVAGGDGIGLLYGAYRLSEHLGARFYLHGDEVPDFQENELVLPVLDERGSPLFPLRGIQPFHDFPEGPDWWDADGYKAVLAQLPKLRMNFFGLHTYPEGGVGPEPAVWIGTDDDVEPDGSVRFAYPSRHFTTGNVTRSWGYEPTSTGDYFFGAGDLFEADVFAARYMEGTHPWPEMGPEESAQLFNRFGDLLSESFSFARQLGIKTGLGTETPLTLPKTVAARIREKGLNPSDMKVVQELYEGMFNRIAKKHPLDYYWFWTPEGWTWEGTKDEQVRATLNDLRAAIAAAEAVEAPFTLATCGWVLGPQQDRALFDKELPKEMPISCINRDVGHDPVEPGFLSVQGRPKWAIPWLEDDPAMIIPQLWVGRMRKDAVDALRYGCTGLMGIHWRTRILGPNVLALARAAWEQEGWTQWPEGLAAESGIDRSELSEDDRRQVYTRDRYLPQQDFYQDWALQSFGAEVAERLAELFTRLDCHLPRPSTWVNGPGGIKPDARPWDDVALEFAFVEEMAALRPQVVGEGNLERFDYWLNSFRYLRSLARVNCTWDLYNRAIDGVKKETDSQKRRESALSNALPLREELVAQVNEANEYLLQTVSTMGALGTVANWQQHVLPMLLGEPGKELADILGESLPDRAQPSRAYAGPPRLIAPVTRTLLNAGEGLNLTVRLLGFQPERVELYWRTLGSRDFNVIQMNHVARGVYGAAISEGELNDDFEYYVRAGRGSVEPLHFPVTAPRINQTVVVMD